MKNNTRYKKAYKEIEKVCEKHLDIADHPDMGDITTMLDSAKNHLLVIEWSEKYGIELPHKTRLYRANYARLNDYLAISYYKDGEEDKEEGSGKYISWSDDKRQPKDEWLLVISFPTGGYIFGEDYERHKQLFQDFFDELKSYNPDYSDTMNSGLYWRLESSSDIYKQFGDILQKYRERNRSELKSRKIEALKEELSQMENNHK